ncbi:helix-turn-helix domain-containing protein [Dietzia cinnamea]|uniref:helix-turn-helix domain-containing protein n=1 Tax=Dietzia cinnamea TaxID=321318 RepID=UPI002882D72E|nr:helix-turn-helix transcriptional regulator [Dietzia cinnamea]
MPISDRHFTSSELRERDIVRRAIGTVVRRLRRAAGLSQIEVAGRANMSERELRRIEKGVGGTPLDRLWALARALDSTPADIVLEAQQIAERDTHGNGE